MNREFTNIPRNQLSNLPGLNSKAFSHLIDMDDNAHSEFFPETLDISLERKAFSHSRGEQSYGFDNQSDCDDKCRTRLDEKAESRSRG